MEVVMMYVDLDSYVDHIQESPEGINFRLAQAHFPDLRVYRNEQGQHLYCSSAAEPEDVDVYSDGEKVYVAPFRTDSKVRVFFDPPIISIGVENPAGFGWVPDLGWEEHLKQFDIPEKIIKKVANKLGARAPADYPEEEGNL